MFLKVAKYKNGRSFLSIVEGYRANGKVKQRVIKKIGFLDELEKNYDDPIQHFKNLARKMSADAKADSSFSLSIDLNCCIDDGYNCLNVGYLPFKYIYNQLGLNDFCINKQKRLNIQFSLNKNLELLAFSRILYPSSKKSTFENKSRFFAPFNNGITRDSIYDCLDYFYLYKKDILKLLWDRS